MKINEIVSEAVNTNTGTPNGNPAPAAPTQPAPAQAQQPSSVAKSGSKLAKGLWGAVKGAYATNRARAAGGENLQKEFDSWDKYVKQRGYVVNLKDPNVFKNELDTWTRNRYPSAGNDVDINKENISSIGGARNYITKMYHAAMTNRAAGRVNQTAPGLPKGVSIVSRDPIIVRYKSLDYAIGNNGQWTALKGNAADLESFQAYLDKVMGGTQQ